MPGHPHCLCRYQAVRRPIQEQIRALKERCRAEGKAWYAPGTIGGMDEKALAKAAAVLGTDRKASVDVDGVPARVHEGMEVEAYKGRMSTVAAIYTDFLRNEAFITKFHLDDHLNKRKQYAATARSILPTLLIDPEMLVIDKEKGAVFYGRWVDQEGRYFFMVIGSDSRMIYTVEVKPGLYENTERHDIIWLREAK